MLFLKFPLLFLLSIFGWGGGGERVQKYKRYGKGFSPAGVINRFKIGVLQYLLVVALSFFFLLFCSHLVYIPLVLAFFFSTSRMGEWD